MNIELKGCYDILMWWMESFGTLIAALSIAFAVLYMFGSLVCLNIYRNIKRLKWIVNEKEEGARIKAKVGKILDNFGLGGKQQQNNYQRNFNQDTMDSTMNETISYVESRT